jgi:hypothetical protein
LKRIEKEQNTIANIFNDSCLFDIRNDANNNHVINTQIAAEAVSTSTIDD